VNGKYVGICLVVFFCCIHVKFPMYVTVKTSSLHCTYESEGEGLAGGTAMDIQYMYWYMQDQE
jgi:hypothetical protein